MTRSRPVAPGREYVAAAPHRSEPVPLFIRIRVIGQPQTIPGVYGFGKVRVVTVNPDGTTSRERAIETTQLHDTPTTRDGQPRRTGYILDEETP